MVRGFCRAETADVFPGLIARNVAVLEYERFVHRNFYPFVIHPHSRFRVYWEIAVLIIIPIRLIVATTLWVFQSPLVLSYSLILTSFQALNLIDVILGFFTGYVESKTEIVVLNHKKIVLNYLFKRFIFDLIPCIPGYLIVYLTHVRHHAFKVVSLFFLMNMFILLRGVTFFLYLYHVSNLFQWYPFLLGIICTPLIVFLLFLLHVNWFSLLIYSKLNERKLQFLKSQKVAFRAKILFQQIDVIVTYLNDSAFSHHLHFFVRFTFLLVFFFCSIMFFVYLIKFVLLKMENKEKFLDLESRILSFVKRYNLPDSLKQKMLLYFLILLENKYSKEVELFNYIPNTFRAEIFFHLCLPLLKSFRPFENFPTYVLRRLAECMTYQLHLPNEVVMAKNETKLSMYFISRGTVALYAGNQVELYHFEAGSSINGKNFMLGEINANQYAISIEVTEVYRLDHDKYKDIMAAHPKLLRSIARKYLPQALKSSALDLTFSWT